MSIFENMNAKEIAICLSAFYEAANFYEAAKKYTHAQLYSTQVRLPNREKPINMDRSDYDEGIKILREDYDVFWTPDTKPDDLKWKINKRRMKALQEDIRKNSYIDTDIVCNRLAFGPGCVVTGNDYLYRRELGLPDNATVADIYLRIRELKAKNSELKDENSNLKENLDVTEHALKAVKQDKQKLEQVVEDISRDRSDIDRLRRHWHSNYEKEHEECVRLSKLHAADKEKKDKQDVVIHNLRDDNTTLGCSVAALKKRIRDMETEAQEKETKNKVITDTLRDNLVDSVEECKKLKKRIQLLEDQLKLNGVPPLKDPLDPGF